MYTPQDILGYYITTGGSVADDEGSESSGGGDNADESMNKMLVEKYYCVHYTSL